MFRFLGSIISRGNNRNDSDSEVSDDHTQVNDVDLSGQPETNLEQSASISDGFAVYPEKTNQETPVVECKVVQQKSSFQKPSDSIEEIKKDKKELREFVKSTGSQYVKFNSDLSSLQKDTVVVKNLITTLDEACLQPRLNSIDNTAKSNTTAIVDRINMFDSKYDREMSDFQREMRYQFSELNKKIDLQQEQIVRILGLLKPQMETNPNVTFTDNEKETIIQVDCMLPRRSFDGINPENPEGNQNQVATNLS